MSRGPADDEFVPRPLGVHSETGPLLRWHSVEPQNLESCRWESLDGRWVSITVAPADDITRVIIEDSAGRSESVDSFEGALLQATAWRT